MGAQQSMMTEADDDQNNKICCMPRSLNESCYGETDKSPGLGDASRFEKWQERMKRQGRDSLQHPSAYLVGADSVDNHRVSLWICGLCLDLSLALVMSE